MYKNILIPTDGSPLSKAAIQAGVQLAALTGAKVTGVYAAPAATPIVYRNLLPVGLASQKENAAAIKKAGERHLDVVVRAAKAAGVRAECVSVVSDYPADTVLAVAKKHKCDLIVMSSHSRKGISAMLLGSQTQQVLAQATIPVLVHR